MNYGKIFLSFISDNLEYSGNALVVKRYSLYHTLWIIRLNPVSYTGTHYLTLIWTSPHACTNKIKSIFKAFFMCLFQLKCSCILKPPSFTNHEIYFLKKLICVYYDVDYGLSSKTTSLYEFVYDFLCPVLKISFWLQI